MRMGHRVLFCNSRHLIENQNSDLVRYYTLHRIAMSFRMIDNMLKQMKSVRDSAEVTKAQMQDMIEREREFHQTEKYLLRKLIESQERGIARLDNIVEEFAKKNVDFVASAKLCCST